MTFENINNSINIKQTERTPEEQLGDFFDKNEGLEYTNSVSSEIYEKLKNKFIAEGLEDEGNNKFLEKQAQIIKEQGITIEEKNKKIKELKVEAERLGIDLDFLGPMSEEALFEARFDPVTGLKNRRELFKKTSLKIKNLFGVSPDTELADEEWLEIIKNEEKDFKNIDSYIMMSDISFLGLTNDLVGHSSGDELLKQISEKMKTSVGECFRHGGDEITGTFDIPRDELLIMIRKAREEVNNIKGLPGLENSSTKPYIPTINKI